MNHLLVTNHQGFEGGGIAPLALVNPRLFLFAFTMQPVLLNETIGSQETFENSLRETRANHSLPRCRGKNGRNETPANHVSRDPNPGGIATSLPVPVL
jgi:hypothetical protein